MPWLQSRGFFFAQPGAVDKTSPVVQMQGKQYAVVGNEGRLDITTKDGLRYSLMFGEVALEDEADTAADKAKPGDKKPDDKKADAAKGDDKKVDDKGAAAHNR